MKLNSQKILTSFAGSKRKPGGFYSPCFKGLEGKCVLSMNSISNVNHGPVTNQSRDLKSEQVDRVSIAQQH